MAKKRMFFWTALLIAVFLIFNHIFFENNPEKIEVQQVPMENDDTSFKSEQAHVAALSSEDLNKLNEIKSTKAVQELEKQMVQTFNNISFESFILQQDFDFLGESVKDMFMDIESGDSFPLTYLNEEGDAAYIFIIKQNGIRKLWSYKNDNTKWIQISEPFVVEGEKVDLEDQLQKVEEAFLTNMGKH